METMGTLWQNLDFSVIRERTTGTNVNEFRVEVSILILGLGRARESAWTLSTCFFTTLSSVDLPIAWCQCLQSTQTTEVFFQPTMSISYLRPLFLK